MIAIPSIDCTEAGTFQVIVTVSGGSGNYSYAFSPSGNYEELTGNTEAGFVSSTYTDGETYYISVVDTESDWEVILESFVECTKVAIELSSFTGRANENNNQLFLGNSIRN